MPIRVYSPAYLRREMYQVNSTTASLEWNGAVVSFDPSAGKPVHPLLVEHALHVLHKRRHLGQFARDLDILCLPGALDGAAAMVPNGARKPTIFVGAQTEPMSLEDLLSHEYVHILDRQVLNDEDCLTIVKLAGKDPLKFSNDAGTPWHRLLKEAVAELLSDALWDESVSTWFGDEPTEAQKAAVRAYVSGRFGPWEPLQVELVPGHRTVKLEVGKRIRWVDGEPEVLDVAPQVVPPGRTLTPTRHTHEPFGDEVWGDGKTVLIKRGVWL